MTKMDCQMTGNTVIVRVVQLSSESSDPRPSHPVIVRVVQSSSESSSQTIRTIFSVWAEEGMSRLTRDLEYGFGGRQCRYRTDARGGWQHLL